MHLYFNLQLRVRERPEILDNQYKLVLDSHPQRGNAANRVCFDSGMQYNPGIFLQDSLLSPNI